MGWQNSRLVVSEAEPEDCKNFGRSYLSEMKIISTPISKKVVLEEYEHLFKKLIKAVVDIEKQVIALDAELHADLEALLLEKGSKQESLWGINLYLEEEKDRQIEYTALINIRPALNNRSMEIENPQTRKKIRQIVNKLIK